MILYESQADLARRGAEPSHTVMNLDQVGGPQPGLGWTARRSRRGIAERFDAPDAAGRRDRNHPPRGPGLVRAPRSLRKCLQIGGQLTPLQGGGVPGSASNRHDWSYCHAGEAHNRRGMPFELGPRDHSRAGCQSAGWTGPGAGPPGSSWPSGSPHLRPRPPKRQDPWCQPRGSGSYEKATCAWRLLRPPAVLQQAPLLWRRRGTPRPSRSTTPDRRRTPRCRPPARGAPD